MVSNGQCIVSRLSDRVLPHLIRLFWLEHLSKRLAWEDIIDVGYCRQAYAVVRR